MKTKTQTLIALSLLSLAACGQPQEMPQPQPQAEPQTCATEPFSAWGGYRPGYETLGGRLLAMLSTPVRPCDELSGAEVYRSARIGDHQLVEITQNDKIETWTYDRHGCAVGLVVQAAGCHGLRMGQPAAWADRSGASRLCLPAND